MSSFTYKAVDQQKQLQQGVLSAKTEKEVAEMLLKKSLTPVVIREVNDSQMIKGKIAAVDKITFCRYMGIMLSTGLSLTEGIDVLKQETKNPVLKHILEDMQYGLEQGQQLSSIFERYPGAFEPYFLTLIRAGEISGKLAEIFTHLELELRAEYSLKSKVKGAMMYPAIIFVAMLGIGILMFFFILPQIGKVFLSLNLPLAAPTRLMFTLSIALTAQIIPIIILVILAIIGGFFALKSQNVKDSLISIFTMIPMIRTLVQKVDIARFCRIFSTLMKSAVPITDALEISLSLLTWKKYRNLRLTVPEKIRKGRTLASAIKEEKAFPSLVIQMIAAGEKTATIDSTMADMATFYEEEVEEEVKGLTQVIEPIMMLAVGVAVGIMILSIIAPIYSVVGNFQQAAGGPGS